MNILGFHRKCKMNSCFNQIGKVGTKLDVLKKQMLYTLEGTVISIDVAA